MIQTRNDRTALLALGLGFFAWTAAGCAEGESAENDTESETMTSETETVEMAAPEPDVYVQLDTDANEYLSPDELSLWFDTEGILERWDIDRDSIVSRDEVMSHSFGLWDRDGNGVIDETEWERATEAWYPGDAEPIVFADWDDDGDSELDADEFSEAFDLSVLGEAWVEDLDKDVFKNVYFELYDLNDDGRVSRLEWDAALEFHGVPNG